MILHKSILTWISVYINITSSFDVLISLSFILLEMYNYLFKTDRVSSFLDILLLLLLLYENCFFF